MDFGRVLTAMVTPFTDNGEVDYERVSLVMLNSIKQEKIKGITFDRF